MGNRPDFYFFLSFKKLLIFISWPCHVACGILVPQPGIEPMPPEVEGQSLNHWTTMEVPGPHFYI